MREAPDRRSFLVALGALATLIARPARALSRLTEGTPMSSQVYTHAMWKVREGNEDRFVEAWTALADTFSNLPRPPIHGTLIRSVQDPSLFYSFGPWQRLEDVEAMRASASAQEALQALVDLCETATPGTFTVVRHVTVPAVE